MYYFAMYMQNWVLDGYMGSEAMMFEHTSGIDLAAPSANIEGSLGPVVH